MELADGPTERGEVATGGCLFALNFSETKVNCTCGGGQTNWNKKPVILS